MKNLNSGGTKSGKVKNRMYTIVNEEDGYFLLGPNNKTWSDPKRSLSYLVKLINKLSKDKK